MIIIIPCSIFQAKSYCSGPESAQFDLRGENAYEILGLPESTTFAEIKASFHKLAKETHPDLACRTLNSSYRFIQILAAYEILSDSSKRAHYDQYLRCQRQMRESKKHFVHHSTRMSDLKFCRTVDVVDWLKWYRLTINEIVTGKRVASGTGYIDEVEAEFYSALRMAFYGPNIDSFDLLPECFEVEERSIDETPEVLHLVSGRYLFGMVCLVSNIRSISPSKIQRLGSFEMPFLGSFKPKDDTFVSSSCHLENVEDKRSDAYKDLEFHVCGRLVALARRVYSRKEDRIHVSLCCHEDFEGNFLMKPLGTIRGLGTTDEEGSCFVYNAYGDKTHMILKHRTLMVKHMHWYGVGDSVSFCECRCSRARLPPSRFWLFEPRCGLHDIGGWYIETYRRDKRGRTVHSQRHWNGFDTSDPFDERLHPAMYLFSVAYRTLDLEDAKRRKISVVSLLEKQLYKALHWCKKLL